MNKLNFTFKKLDKYILGSLIETFIFGIVVFGSVMLASDAFLDVVRQMTKFSIPINWALLVIGLRLPGIIVYTIPMALLVAVILTYNRLNINLEIIAIRASGVSLYRLLVPALVMGIITGSLTLLLNEFVVPKANYQARNIMLWAITQKNLPGKSSNFVYKELSSDNNLRRLFYIDDYRNHTMKNVIVLDFTQPRTTKIIQAETVSSGINTWNFNNGKVYTVSADGKVSNTSSFSKILLTDPVNVDLTRKDTRSKEFNYLELAQEIEQMQSRHKKVSKSLLVKWHEKLSIPFACLIVALIGVPLAIAPPRTRFNRGLAFSVAAIFVYYLIRAVSMSLGEIGTLPPFVAAWLPNVVILFLALYLLHKKNYC